MARAMRRFAAPPAGSGPLALRFDGSISTPRLGSLGDAGARAIRRTEAMSALRMLRPASTGARWSIRPRRVTTPTPSKTSHLFHGGTGLLLGALPKPFSTEVQRRTIRHLVFDDTLCGEASLPAVLDFVKDHRARWSSETPAPRYYALVRVTEVNRAARGRIADAGVIMLGHLQSAELDGKARELEEILPGLPGPSESAPPLPPWPRPQGEPRPLTDTEQVLADEIIAASRLERDRTVD